LKKIEAIIRAELMSNVELVASDSQVGAIVQAIVETARTGEHGDGIVSISNVERAINIYHLGRT